jgi:hypothetical protein
MPDDKTDFKMSALPPCNIRMGRFYDGRAVMTCGWREVQAEECIKCGGGHILGKSKKEVK